MEALRAAMRWTGAIDRTLIAHLTGFDRAQGWSSEAYHDPVRWALGVLGFERGAPRRAPGRVVVQRRFRELVRDAHPDHGGDTDDAANRIAELSEARRILLAVP
jgi:hypothetical protein